MAMGRHPVLHFLAVVCAARDFGLDRDELHALAARFRSPDALADAVTAALLAREP
jgi:hypothetical protein